MVRKTRGNLLDAEVDALVNTVNAVGVMGKGVALQFKRAFPANFKAYKQACDAGDVEPGRMFIHDLGGLMRPRYIINFPTKRHWRERSRMEDIEVGLAALVEDIRRLGIESIALPPLGCGHGGLNWNMVFPLIERALAELVDVDVIVYEPAGAPAPEEMKDRTERPKMTIGRAAVLGLMNRYQVPGYDYLMSLLEVQKLAYFLQEAGELLRLKYAKHLYGPYADNLRHVLQRIEGHFILGFGDGRNAPDTALRVLPEAATEADEFLKAKEATLDRLGRVTELIEGFETPFGMELLSSVHWVAKHDLSGKGDRATIADGVHAWNDRKRNLFAREHLEIAWEQLHGYGWL